jgi:PEGA domain-containing protein
MAGRAVSCVVALLGAVVLLTPDVSAQERSAPAGAVIVRPVQVREVRVNQPTPPRPDQVRPSFGVERPMDPGFISRPIPRPPQSVTVPRSNLGRNRSHQFRPRFNNGLGIVVGYPVIYPYAYPYDPFSPSSGAYYNPAPPAPNTYSNVDSASNAGFIAAAPALPASIACQGAAPCGGVIFDIAPGNAQVYVDGIFAGVVDDFDENSAPLLLAPGAHYVEIRLTGYRTATFDVTIAQSEVTPYQGTLDRLRLQGQ